MCSDNGIWEDLINVTLCINEKLVDILQRLNDNINNNSNASKVANNVQGISEELINVTRMSSGTISPNDLNTTIEIIDTITR